MRPEGFSQASTIALSVVMPVRDEALRLPKTLQALCCYASTLRIPFEVLISDDGSRDATCQVAQRFRTGLPLRWLTSQRRGVGNAVRQAIKAVRGQRILVCDADGAVPFEELDKLWRALDEGHDVAVGSRRLRPQTVEVKQRPHRVLAGRVWAHLVRLLARVPVSDTQCGFKLFTRDAARALLLATRSHSFAYHVESLRLAQRHGHRIAEIPVRWRDQPGSQIRLWRDPMHMFIELLTCTARSQ